MKYGVESLNQIARDMYRGPKGIDSFVQYMELGGEVALGEPLALLNVGYDSSALREKILKETGVDINRIAEEEGVDPEIFARLIFKESAGDPNAVGDDGKAQGYLQLHAAAAEEVGVDRSDPVQNLVGGARYLKKNLDTFGGDYEKALQAYNAGPTRVARGDVPETTLAYASSILGSGPRKKTPPVDQTSAVFRPDTPEPSFIPVANPGGGPVVIQEPSLDTVATVNRLEVPEFIREAQEPVIQASAVVRPDTPEPSLIRVANPGGGPVVIQKPSFETVAAVNKPEIPEPTREAIAMVRPDTPSGIGSIALGNLSEIFTQQETPRLKPSKISVRGPSGSRMAPPGMGTLPEMSMQGLDAFRELYQETTPYRRTPLKPST